MALGGLYFYYLHQQFTVLNIILVQLVQKIVHTNLPQAGFELGSLGPQAGVLPIEPPLLVSTNEVHLPLHK